MRLTTFTDYTIRVLVYLGLNKHRLTTAAELAEWYGVSRNHLTKVVHFLGQQGYIETLRGKGGGIRLAQGTETVRLGEVIQEAERDTTLVECFGSKECNCRILPACRFTGMLRKAEYAFYDSLNRYTLADLIEQNDPLEKIVSVGNASHEKG